MSKKSLRETERDTKISDKSRYQRSFQNKIEQKKVKKKEIKNEGVAGK